MSHKQTDLLWALAIVGGLLYLATKAAEQKLPPVQPEPRPEPAIDPVALVAPLTIEAAPVATFPVTEFTMTDERNEQLIANARNAIAALESRTESGRILEIDGPQTF